MTTDPSDLPDILDPFEHYIVHDDNTVTFTVSGMRYYKPYFTRAGLDVNNIITLEDLIQSKRIIAPLEMADMKQRLLKKPPSIQRDLILSLVQGDIDEFERLFAKLEKCKQSSMKVVK